MFIKDLLFKRIKDLPLERVLPDSVLDEDISVNIQKLKDTVKSSCEYLIYKLDSYMESYKVPSDVIRTLSYIKVYLEKIMTISENSNHYETCLNCLSEYFNIVVTYNDDILYILKHTHDSYDPNFMIRHYLFNGE